MSSIDTLMSQIASEGGGANGSSIFSNIAADGGDATSTPTSSTATGTTGTSTPSSSSAMSPLAAIAANTMNSSVAPTTATTPASVTPTAASIGVSPAVASTNMGSPLTMAKGGHVHKNHEGITMASHQLSTIATNILQLTRLLQGENPNDQTIKLMSHLLGMASHATINLHKLVNSGNISSQMRLAVTQLHLLTSYIMQLRVLLMKIPHQPPKIKVAMHHLTLIASSLVVLHKMNGMP